MMKKRIETMRNFQVIGIILCVMLFFNLNSLKAQNSFNASEFIFYYQNLAFCDSLNTYYQALSDLEKAEIILEVHEYASLQSNFKCENIIYIGDGKLKYNWKMEVLNEWENWRLKKELVYILLHDLLKGTIANYKNSAFLFKDKVFKIDYNGRNKELNLNGNKSNNCKRGIIEKMYHNNILRKVKMHFKKLMLEIKKEGFSNFKKKEFPILPKDIQLISDNLH
jgi:hypothetical protein